MKILSILNISNREKPGFDSGIIFNRLFFSELIKHGYQCTLVSPLNLKIKGLKSIVCETGSSKYEVRFRFEWDAQKKIVLKEKPDMLFVNQAELTENYRALLVSMSSPIRIATFCHYLPVFEIKDTEIIWDESLNHHNLAESILFKIFTAVTLADHFFVASHYAKKLLIQSAMIYNIPMDQAKINILPCPADPGLFNAVPAIIQSTPYLLYNHRLYKHYGTEFLLELIEKLADTSFKFVITDFFSKRNNVRKKLDKNIDEYRRKIKALKSVAIRTDGDDRGIYKNEIIARSWVGIGPYRLNAIWSMATMDCLGMGKPVICPDIAAFPEFVPKALLFKDQDDALRLIKRLSLEPDFYQKCSTEAIEMTRQFLPVEMVRKFIDFTTNGK